MRLQLFKYGYYILFNHKDLWNYFQIGKYYLDKEKNWYEIRVALDFFYRGKGFSFCKIFGEK